MSGLSSELDKLNELYKSGALSKEEFEKAKAKLLEN
ncbi:MAG: SHOCT domain-containing protein [Thermoproteota archaeon]|nr:SHOCT domain-containing protein [Thermoproteota archaeon]MEC9087104.1 SHOCT domain-containing protein [Thermoproteota archaeon]